MAMRMPSLKPEAKREREYAEFPKAPLSWTFLKNVDGGDPCYRLIEERHHVAQVELFKRLPDEKFPNTRWDAYYLSKLALMRLEAISPTMIASFFTEEFSKLERVETDVSEPKLNEAMNDYFSEKLIGKIGERNRDPVWTMLRSNPKNAPLIKEIARRTRLKPEELFVRRSLSNPADKLFSSYEILQAFLMRLNRQSLMDIFPQIRREWSLEDAKSLTSIIHARFSPKARASIPENVAEAEDEG